MFNFKVTFSNGASIKLMNLADDTTLDMLRAAICEKSEIPPEEQNIMTGYPPKPTVGEGTSLLSSLGIRTGSVLVLKEPLLTPDSRPAQPTTVFLRRVVPADNSCLFNCVSYAMGQSKSGGGPAMRQIIKDTILADPEQYNDVFLGRPVFEYCAWIQDDKSWGGEIELSILADHFKLEIVVFDVTSMSRLCYGEDRGFTQRMFLLYDGMHYDLVVESPSKTAPESRDATLFSFNDFSKVERASEVAVEAHQNHEYTNVSGFHILCMRCRKTFVGQREARAHADATGHQEFGEVRPSAVS